VTASALAEWDPCPGYLDYARFGPPPLAVRAAGDAVLEQVSNPTAGTAAAIDAAAVALKSAAAQLLRRPSAYVAVAPSTSDGMLQVAMALPGHGNVVLPARAFPAMVYPFVRAAERGGPAVRRVEGRDVDALLHAMDEDTTTVVVSAVDSATGARVDLAQLRDAIGDRLLVVDAIQALGVVDEPWEVADVVIAGGQKWLRSGWGAAVLATSDRALERLTQPPSGWLGVVDPMTFDGDIHDRAPGADRFVVTGPNPVACQALSRSMGVLLGAGAEQVQQCVTDRVAYLMAALPGVELITPRDPRRFGGIVSFRVPGLPATHVQAVAVSRGLVLTQRQDFLRAAVHATTPWATLDDLCVAVHVSRETEVTTPVRNDGAVVVTRHSR
jgi:selenocysteine lyase/cysteine desulfurase